MGFIDVHQHIVYGVDDGPRTWEESLAMLGAAARDGIEGIVATSHAYAAMEAFPLEQYLRHLQTLRQLCRERGIPIRLYSGCEIFYSDVAIRQLASGRLPTLGETPYVLVEFDPTSSGEAISDAVRRLANAGYRSVVAHCERYEGLYRRFDFIQELIDNYHAAFQINASSLTDWLPRKPRKFRDEMLKRDLVSFIATDAHNCGDRPPLLSGAMATLTRLFDEEYAWSLLRDRPGTLLGIGARSRRLTQEGI